METIRLSEEGLPGTPKLVCQARQPNNTLVALVRLQPKGIEPLERRVEFNLPSNSSTQNEPATVRGDSALLDITTVVAPRSHNLDIVAISGLNGNAYGSFKERNQDYMWLIDTLPRSLPRARISLFGYLSDYSDAVSHLSLQELGNSLHKSVDRLFGNNQTKLKPGVPMVYMLHSLGGLIFQQAFLKSYALTTGNSGDSIHGSTLYDLAGGMICFGVPFHGMHIEPLLKIVQHGPAREFLQTLNQSSYILSDLNESFHDAAKERQLRAYCYSESKDSRTVESEVSRALLWQQTSTYEQTPQETRDGTKVFEGKGRAWIVRPESAETIVSSLRQPRNRSSLPRTHTELVKFGRDDDELPPVIDDIKRICSLVVSASAEAQSRGRVTSEVKFVRDEPTLNAGERLQAKQQLEETIRSHFMSERGVSMIPAPVDRKLRSWIAAFEDRDMSKSFCWVYGKNRQDEPMVRDLSSHIVSELLRIGHPLLAVSFDGEPDALLRELYDQLSLNYKLYWHLSPNREPTSGDLGAFLERLRVLHNNDHTWDSNNKRRLTIVIHARYGMHQTKLTMVERIVTELKQLRGFYLLVVTETWLEGLRGHFGGDEGIAVSQNAHRPLKYLRFP
ncbi:hypothetical protein PG996_011189 [Apiospora saccharicola]|uniref:DUF676 domain-containing protein n=1 Tax=Apiospora saccharicola TaxID=335842 RepID=A0ABR1UEC0_9PEZI